MIYLLDTSTVSEIMRENPRVASHLRGDAADVPVVTCTIVKGEILHGILRLPKGRRQAELSAKADATFRAFPCEPVPVEAARHYAELKAACQRRGLPMDENDLWIAATAEAVGAIVVTCDSDFSRMDRVRVTDWTQ